MKVTFVNIGHITWPIGGVKMIYEYANRLSQNGHSVEVLLPLNMTDRQSWKDELKSLLAILRRRSRRKPLVGWFPVSDKVRQKLIPNLSHRYLPSADVIVASSWQTAELLADAPTRCGNKAYFIQHYEDWDGEVERMNRTWTLPFRKIVVSKWLLEIANQFGEQANSTYIPYGIDFDKFFVDVPVRSRGCTVSMLYHRPEWYWKGTTDGLAALAIVKKRIPAVKVTLFGVNARGSEIADWIDLETNPPQTRLREIYNNSAVFVAPSHSEGWGLPPAEAMACGCAVAGADNGGIRDYAVSNVNALLSEPRDPMQLAESICRLLEDQPLRWRIAERAREDIQRFRWNDSVASMERVLSGR